MALFKLTRRRIFALLGWQSALLPGALTLGSTVDENTGGAKEAGASGGPSQSAMGKILHPMTAAERTASVTPTNFAYPPGNPRRYGAVGDGVTDDTAALSACISTRETYIGNAGDIFGVTKITFPSHGPSVVRFKIGRASC